METQNSKTTPVSTGVDSTQQISPYFDEYYSLPSEIREHLDRVRAALSEQKDIDQLIPELLNLIEQYPQVPAFTYHMGQAYMQVNNNEQIEYWIKECYRRFPKYLLARCAYANYCMKYNRLTEVPVIFNNCFSLSILYGKELFSSSEVEAFYHMLTNFHLSLGSFDSAYKLINLIKTTGGNEELAEQLTARLQMVVQRDYRYDEARANKEPVRSSKRRKK